MSLLHPHREHFVPFEEDQPPGDEIVELRDQRRQLRAEISALRRDLAGRDAEIAALRHELDQTRRQLRKRWWQR